jgi:hypothetical protein
VGFGHSMTWSARRSSEGGIVRPRAFGGHHNVGVEPIVHQPQLRRLVAHEHGGERGSEASAVGVEFGLSRHHARPICRRRLLASEGVL